MQTDIPNSSQIVEPLRIHPPTNQYLDGSSLRNISNKRILLQFFDVIPTWPAETDQTTQLADWKYSSPNQWICSPPPPSRKKPFNLADFHEIPLYQNQRVKKKASGAGRAQVGLTRDSIYSFRVRTSVNISLNLRFRKRVVALLRKVALFSTPQSPPQFSAVSSHW